MSNESDIHHLELACIRERENIINKEQLGFIPINLLPQYLNQIKPGDIIGIVRDIPGIDVSHMGIAYVKDNNIGIIHASSKEQKVILSQNLLHYLNQFKNIQGVVILRLSGKFIRS